MVFCSENVIYPGNVTFSGNLAYLTQRCSPHEISSNGDDNLKYPVITGGSAITGNHPLIPSAQQLTIDNPFPQLVGNVLTMQFSHQGMNSPSAFAIGGPPAARFNGYLRGIGKSRGVGDIG